MPEPLRQDQQGGAGPENYTEPPSPRQPVSPPPRPGSGQHRQRSDPISTDGPEVRPPGRGYPSDPPGGRIVTGTPRGAARYTVKLPHPDGTVPPGQKFLSMAMSRQQARGIECTILMVMDPTWRHSEYGCYTVGFTPTHGGGMALRFFMPSYLLTDAVDLLWLAVWIDRPAAGFKRRASFWK